MNTEFSCQEMIEVVTNYLDDALPPDEQQRFERHLSYCAGCNTYVDQIRETIRQTRMVPREEWSSRGFGTRRRAAALGRSFSPACGFASALLRSVSGSTLVRCAEETPIRFSSTASPCPSPP